MSLSPTNICFRLPLFLFFLPLITHVSGSQVCLLLHWWELLEVAVVLKPSCILDLPEQLLEIKSLDPTPEKLNQNVGGRENLSNGKLQTHPRAEVSQELCCKLICLSIKLPSKMFWRLGFLVRSTKNSIYQYQSTIRNLDSNRSSIFPLYLFLFFWSIHCYLLQEKQQEVNISFEESLECECQRFHSKQPRYTTRVCWEEK